MSRKHFEALAAKLRALKPDEARDNLFTLTAKLELWLELVGSIADMCASANPNFNRSRFFDACDADIEGGG